MLNDYLNLLEEKKRIDEQILDIQKEIYIKFKKELDNMETGTFNTTHEGFKVKIIKKETVTVDQDLADVVGIAFKKKYSLDKKAYKALSADDQKRVDECITTKPAKPSFTIERIEE